MGKREDSDLGKKLKKMIELQKQLTELEINLAKRIVNEREEKEVIKDVRQKQEGSRETLEKLFK